MEELIHHWTQMPVHIKAYAWDGIIVLATLLIARVIAGDLQAWLGKTELNDLLRFPAMKAGDTSKPSAPKLHADRWIASFCRGTIWLVGLWIILQRHDQAWAANALLPTIGKLWMLVVVLIVIWIAAAWLSRLTDDFLRHCAKRFGWDDYRAPSGHMGLSTDTMVFMSSLSIAGIFTLAGLMATVEIFRLEQTASAMLLLWKLALAVLSAALVIGLGGFGWHSMVKKAWPEGDEHPADLDRNILRIAVPVLAVVVAMAVLSGAGGVVIALLVLLACAVVIWPVSEHLKDILAGLVLRVHKAPGVTLDGQWHRIDEVGWLMSLVTANAVRHTLTNRAVLDAMMAPPQPAEGDTGA